MFHEVQNRAELAIMFGFFFFAGIFVGFALSMLPAFDWTAFWTGLGALATFAAAYIVIRELPKIRRESAKLQVEALDYVLSQLEARDFMEWTLLIRRAWIAGDKEYPSEIEDEIVHIFSRLDYIAYLIELNYIDEELVFYTRANDLYMIERAITNFENRAESQIPGVRAAYYRGYDLLKRAADFAQRTGREQFDRIDEYSQENDAQAP